MKHIEIRPCTVKRAQQWVAETHRKLKKHRWWAPWSERATEAA